MREPSIIFSAAQVRAVLDGTKTQMRRVVKQAMAIDGPAASVHPDGAGVGWIAWWPNPVSAAETARLYPGAEGFRCPFGQPGDRLWVKETWNALPLRKVFYRADGPMHRDWKWRPSGNMPRWASRITLEIVGVRVERLHQITDADVVAEGVEPQHIEKNRKFFHRNDVHALAYAEMWQAANGKTHPWASNCWVWRIAFNRLPAPAAPLTPRSTAQKVGGA